MKIRELETALVVTTKQDIEAYALSATSTRRANEMATTQTTLIRTEADMLDALTLQHTACNSFDALCDVTGTDYFPTLYTHDRFKGSKERAILADAYDARMAAIGDSRRAFRGSKR